MEITRRDSDQVSIYAVMAGLTYPLLTLILESRGIEKFIIGLNAAMMPLGFIVSSPLVPRLAAIVGAKRLVFSAFLLNGSLLLAIGITNSLEIWFFLRFLLGMSGNCLFVVSEAWINELVDRRFRGRVLGLYSTSLSVGFGVGALSVSVTGSGSWVPFLIGALASWAGVPILLTAWRSLPAFPRQPGASLWTFVPLARTLVVSVAILAFFDQAALSLFPVYALSHGLGEAAAAAGVAALVLGNTALQIPIGWLADHVPRRSMILACAIITVAGSLALPIAVSIPFLLWPLLFVWGAFSYGVFTVTLAELGDRFSGPLLLAGNAAFAMMWGIGGLIGPPVVGTTMQVVGPEGFPLSLGLSYAALVGISAFTLGSRTRGKP